MNRVITIRSYQIFGAIFLTLKLCGVIDWRWLWVLAPWWITLILDIIYALVKDKEGED